MTDFEELNYYGSYDDYCEPKDVPYEVYQSEINEKNREIEKLQTDLEDCKSILEIFKNEVKRYEEIFTRKNK